MRMYPCDFGDEECNLEFGRRLSDYIYHHKTLTNCGAPFWCSGKIFGTFQSHKGPEDMRIYNLCIGTRRNFTHFTWIFKDGSEDMHMQSLCIETRIGSSNFTTVNWIKKKAQKTCVFKSYA